MVQRRSRIWVSAGAQALAAGASVLASGCDGLADDCELNLTCTRFGVVPACAEASPGDIVCDGNKRLECGPDLLTVNEVETCPYVCSEGECTGECVPGSKRCAGNTPETCDTNGEWQGGQPCSAGGPVCVDGVCATPPSCQGLPLTCGPRANESCCAITVVPGGTYNRSNDPTLPATVSDFRLDRFEITVGRFRRFVEAYPGSRPKPGTGAHPSTTGWDPAWDGGLPNNSVELMTAVKCSSNFWTWTDTAGPNENLPMNCIDWYDAFAFCIWDGGRLPTEAEWDYAAAAGNEQRDYPWGTGVDSSYATYLCEGAGSAGLCKLDDILEVDSKSPKGDGKWGQTDLAGSMTEWVLDADNGYPVPCEDCVSTPYSAGRIARGGSWQTNDPDILVSYRVAILGTESASFVGARCARTP